MRKGTSRKLFGDRALRATGAALFAVAALAAAMPAAIAGTMKPYSIRADKALVSQDSTAHFGCELRSFSSTGLACYGPDAIRKAYDLDGLIAAGFNGTGQTIVIIDAFGSPTLASDLATFDAVFGLPAPPSLQQIRMPGSRPFDYTDGNQLGWAEETSLDVQWAHAIAPGASIIVVAAVDNSDSAILDAQNFAIQQKLGSIISESFGESELALIQAGRDGQKILDDNERSYQRAGNQKISVLVSSGDDGAAGTDINGVLQTTPVANYPASSPNVTTVGGTNLFFGKAGHADPNGAYIGETVWNDGFGAGGGGISAIFRVPDFQENLKFKGGPKDLKARGYPDVAYNAGVEGGVLVFLGFLDTAFGPGNNGFYIFGGTSASAPQWAGITAIANQKSRKPLGFLNKSLYKLGKSGTLGTVLNDITTGNNNFAGVTGFPATAGWDFATGWGTPNAGLINSLVKDEDENGDD
ncbi:MAG: S53 family peptidase [Usitatibacter sp.]